jgi:hyperosmotically inducible protein
VRRAGTGGGQYRGSDGEMAFTPFTLSAFCGHVAWTPPHGHCDHTSTEEAVMKKFTSPTLLSTALAFGLTLAAGQALAVDPPTAASKDHDSMAHADGTKHDSKEPVTDTWITTKVKADLLATKDVSGTDIKVETVNGTVKLSGTVESKAQHDKAVSVTKMIDGVKKVDASGLKVSSAAKR